MKKRNPSFPTWTPRRCDELPRTDVADVASDVWWTLGQRSKHLLGQKDLASQRERQSRLDLCVH